MNVSDRVSERSVRSRSSAGVTGLRSGETKHALRTTELAAYLATVFGVLIAAAVVGDGENGQDVFGARSAWLYVTILTVGYMVSRGLSKAGSREPYAADTDA